MAETVMSVSSKAAASTMPSVPDTILRTESPSRCFNDAAAAASDTAARTGLNVRICRSRRSMFLPAARATTRKRSGNCSTTESVDLPMEPVEPSMDIRFIRIRSQESGVRTQK
jgi:hypothetical protein